MLPPWLRVVFRHYVRYLFFYRRIDEDTFAWLLVFVPGRSYPKETYISEYRRVIFHGTRYS